MVEETTEPATPAVTIPSTDESEGGDGDTPETPTPTRITTTPSSVTSKPSHHDEPINLTEEDEGERADSERKVRARDANISGLEKLRLEKQQELDLLQKELESERLQQMKESILHRIEVERLKRQTKAVEERLTVLERDMQNKEAIREYAELIKSVAPKGGSVDSQYVMKLQSQLAKAVKRMDATSYQMVQVEQSCEEVVNSLKKEISEIVEDRCRTELELRKQLELLEEQKVEMESEYDDRIRLNQQELERLKEKVTVEVTLADLEEELEDTEAKLEKLNNVQEMQKRTIEELNETLKNNGGGDDDQDDEGGSNNAKEPAAGNDES